MSYIPNSLCGLLCVKVVLYYFGSITLLKKKHGNLLYYVDMIYQNINHVKMLAHWNVVRPKIIIFFSLSCVKRSQDQAGQKKHIPWKFSGSLGMARSSSSVSLPDAAASVARQNLTRSPGFLSLTGNPNLTIVYS